MRSPERTRTRGFGGDDLGHRHELTRCVEVSVAERGVDGENLAIADSARRTRLRDTAAFDSSDYFHVNSFIAPCIREILCGRPRAASARHRLEGRDASTETRTAEEKPAARREAGYDLERK
jgi:hypothetical protein